MTDWAIQRQFLLAKRECLMRVLNMLPADKRALVIKSIKDKPYMSATRYMLRQHFPDWPDVMIEDFGTCLIHDFNAVRNSRNSLARLGRDWYDPLKMHWVKSLEAIQQAFRMARPSGATVEPERTVGRTGITGSAPFANGKRTAYKVKLSPSYKRFTDKIGITVYKHHVILSGFLALKPFEDGEIWCCEVEDTKARERKTIYIGRHMHDYVAHVRMSTCIGSLEKEVAKKCIAEMRAGEGD